MAIDSKLREARTQSGLSQQALAYQAGVSLATVQNLEAGKGNPELKTLLSLASVLSLELELRPVPLDWDVWAHFGVPLISEGEEVPYPPQRHLLLEHIQKLPTYLPHLREDTREAQAFTGFLWALKDHYPSIWNRSPRLVRGWLSNQKLSYSLVKLRRLALERLSQYL